MFRAASSYFKAFLRVILFVKQKRKGQLLIPKLVGRPTNYFKHKRGHAFHFKLFRRANFLFQNQCCISKRFGGPTFYSKCFRRANLLLKKTPGPILYFKTFRRASFLFQTFFGGPTYYLKKQTRVSFLFQSVSEGNFSFRNRFVISKRVGGRTCYVDNTIGRTYYFKHALFI